MFLFHHIQSQLHKSTQTRHTYMMITTMMAMNYVTFGKFLRFEIAGSHEQPSWIKNFLSVKFLTKVFQADL